MKWNSLKLYKSQTMDIEKKKRPKTMKKANHLSSRTMDRWKNVLYIQLDESEEQRERDDEQREKSDRSEEVGEEKNGNH